MSRIYNFNAGPAALPLEVIEEAQRELVDFRGTGMSLLESSHRAKAYDADASGHEGGRMQALLGRHARPPRP